MGYPAVQIAWFAGNEPATSDIEASRADLGLTVEL